MEAVVKAGGELNQDFGTEEVRFPEGVKAKSFTYTSWLSKADAIIDFAKLKTHGMAGMTCAVKNFFGTIPGTRKPEMHYMYPNTADFCSMLVDLALYNKPRLTLVDAVDCMEGNGPTPGYAPPHGRAARRRHALQRRPRLRPPDRHGRQRRTHSGRIPSAAAFAPQTGASSR